MTTYQFYIHDTRYSVPTLVFVEAVTEAGARSKATDLLLQSRFHERVEIVANGASLPSVERTAGMRRASPRH